jgi:hypothetical protein
MQRKPAVAEGHVGVVEPGSFAVMKMRNEMA